MTSERLCCCRFNAALEVRGKTEAQGRFLQLFQVVDEPDVQAFLLTVEFAVIIAIGYMSVPVTSRASPSGAKLADRTPSTDWLISE